MSDEELISMFIPYQQLSHNALQALIEDFVSRDGTDNGDETSFSTKIERVKQALSKQQAFIWYDSQSRQCQLMAKHQIPREMLQELDKA